MPLLIFAAPAPETTYLNYTAATPRGWIGKAENLLAEGAPVVTRRKMTFRPRGSTGAPGEAELTIFSFMSTSKFDAYARDDVGNARQFGSLGAPVRVAPLTTADGRSVRVYVFPKGIGQGYQRRGFVQLPGGYAVFELRAPSGAGRRVGNPAFTSVIRSFRYVE